MTHCDIHRKESGFHDRWAEHSDQARIAVRELFEHPTSQENEFILELMGPLEGRRVLDIGAGLGESSVYFSLQGAEVTMADISPGMVSFARRLGERFGVKIRGVVCAAERLSVASNHYDVVYLGNVIHHVMDRDRLFREIRRVLKPGGWFYSWDPLAYNPVINVYRKMATEVRTEDEQPLTVRDLRLARSHFVEVGHREFWILGLVLFLKYYLVDRVHPNEDRYWKRILKESAESIRWWLPLKAIDRVICRLPLIGRLAWNTVMWGRKPERDVGVRDKVHG